LEKEKKMNLVSAEQIMRGDVVFDMTGDRCAECGVPLSTHITGRVKTPTGDICSDCHFEQLASCVEQTKH
jgi:uncharacterized Zn finger protein (UPF0148 family)